MDKRPTVGDVADLAGVHRSTAARALNPATRSMLSQETAERVSRAARSLGYRANSFARGLRTNRSLTVGVMIPDLNNPLFPPIVRGIEEALLPHGYTAFIANTDNDPVREAVHFRAFLSRQVDGFLIATARDNDETLDEVARLGIAAVLINRTNAQRELPLVSSDNRQGMQIAVDHLVAVGHRRIAHLAGPTELSTAVVRLSGFKEAAASHLLPQSQTPIFACSGLTEQAGEAGAATLLSTRPDVTAIVAANDLIALGVLRALAKRGLNCPNDMSLVGFNDMRFADAFNPPLTTVHVSHRLIGSEAARLLLERLVEPHAPAKTMLLPVRLVVRASTCPPRACYS
jgi:LacI family transcriptional regulator